MGTVSFRPKRKRTIQIVTCAKFKCQHLCWYGVGMGNLDICDRTINVESCRFWNMVSFPSHVFQAYHIGILRSHILHVLQQCGFCPNGFLPAVQLKSMKSSLIGQDVHNKCSNAHNNHRAKHTTSSTDDTLDG